MKTVLFVAILLSFNFNLLAQIEGREWADAGKVKGAEPILEKCAPGTRVYDVMVPMADGVKLATTVFVPPVDKPRPAIFVSTPYGRFGLARSASACKDGDYVFVTQDLRGSGDSEGKDSFDASSFDVHVKDMASSLAWIAEQNWSNGKIAMHGGSGNGIAPYAAFLSGSPQLTVSSPGNSSGHAWYWMFDNRVRRNLYRWMVHNGLNTQTFPRPTLSQLSYEDVIRELGSYSVNPESILIASGGWFDIVGESVLDMFSLFADKAKVYAIMSPSRHVGQVEIDGGKYNMYSGRPKQLPKYLDILNGKALPQEKSYLMYYLMGDATRENSIANKWMLTEVWPVPHEKTSFYLNADGSVSRQKNKQESSQTFTYDPRNPAPMNGGNVTYQKTDGPMDQRFLQARKDVLRFTSEPLSEPIVITGKVGADLYVSTTAEDTSFVVKFVDIYPSGYEALIRESAVMGRYAEGLDGKTPLQNGRIYHLKMDLWSTALALEEGHRIGVYVTSSSAAKQGNRLIEAYEIHPNTFNPVDSLGEATVAEQTLHFGGKHPSALILPVVK